MFYRLEIGQGITKCRLRIILSQNRFMTRLEATQILGIEQNSSRKEIKKAYIELAKLYHPDSKVIQILTHVSHATFQTGCDKRFRQVQTANEVLLRGSVNRPRNTVDNDAMNEVYKNTGTSDNQETMDDWLKAREMSREAKNDSSIQVILQILFIGIIGMLPTCLRYFQGDVFDEYIFEAVCTNFYRRLSEISTKNGKTRTFILEDFIAHCHGIELKYLSEEDFIYLDNSFYNTHPKCKSLIIQNPTLVYPAYKREETFV